MLAKLMALFLSLFYMFNPYVGPSTDDAIKAKDAQNLKLSFVTVADPQLSNYLFERDPYVKGAGEDLKNSELKFDAVVMAGDIAENGLACEYETVKEYFKDANTDAFLMAVGNHDVRLRSYKQVVERFTAWANDMNKEAGSEFAIDKLHYTYEVNGYTFIVMGTDTAEFEESYISEEQLAWLDSSLMSATADGKPAFVILHQPLKDTHGLPDTWGSADPRKGSVGEQNDELIAIMEKYSNVILITGHLHTGLGQYTYQTVNGFHSINLPSLAITNKDGSYNDAGIGFVVEVYENNVIFRARDFAKGVYIPDYDINIDLTSAVA